MSCRRGFLRVTLTAQNVAGFHELYGVSTLERLQKMPNADRIKQFVAALPPYPVSRASGIVLRSTIQTEMDAYEEKLLSAYNAELERISAPRADNATILEGAQRGHVTDVKTMIAICSEKDDEAGVIFWTVVKRLLSNESLETIFNSNTSGLTKYQLGKCASQLDTENRFWIQNIARSEIPYYQTVNNRARAAIRTWLRVGIRWRVVKDIRRVIGQILWDIRHEWSY